MKELFLALLTLLATAQLTLAQTDYEKCLAEADTHAEQTNCALNNG